MKGNVAQINWLYEFYNDSSNLMASFSHRPLYRRVSIAMRRLSLYRPRKKRFNIRIEGTKKIMVQQNIIALLSNHDEFQMPFHFLLYVLCCTKITFAKLN